MEKVVDAPIIQCSDCREVLDETADGLPKPPCPYCGSIKRHVTVQVRDEVKVREKLRTDVKDPSRPRKRRLRKQIVSGDDLHRDSGRWMKLDRVIDKDKDRYQEKIVDSETGEIVRDIDEPLSKHRGHGSAKVNKNRNLVKRNQNKGNENNDDA